MNMSHTYGSGNHARVALAIVGLISVSRLLTAQTGQQPAVQITGQATSLMPRTMASSTNGQPTPSVKGTGNSCARSFKS